MLVENLRLLLQCFVGTSAYKFDLSMSEHISVMIIFVACLLGSIGSTYFEDKSSLNTSQNERILVQFVNLKAPGRVVHADTQFS